MPLAFLSFDNALYIPKYHRAYHMETGKVYHTRMKQKIHPHQILKFRVHIFANQGQIRHTGVDHQYTLAYQISPGSVYSVVLIAAKSPNSRFLLQFQLSPPGGIETKLNTGAQLYEPSYDTIRDAILTCARKPT